MNDQTTSLDRLHDLALPPGVPWWPLAAGWYVVLLAVLVLAVVLAHRAWKSHRAGAYRRAALRELAAAHDAAAIATVLRRTALAVATRQAIAQETGSAWLDWLAQRYPAAVPAAVRVQLTAGVYGRSTGSADLTALREFAADWIKQHHPSVINP